MKNYENTDNFRERTHTVRVTFQSKEYKGHIAYEIGGNCQGLDVMDFDPDCIDNNDIKLFTENDCQFSLNEEYDVFEMALTNEKGDTCEFDDCDSDDIRRMVVSIEIIDCRFSK